MRIEIPHSCGRTHRGHQSLAECTWPAAAYVIGDGPFAVLARCDLFTVALYETSAEAGRRKAGLDADGCGKACDRRHELVGLIGGTDELEPPLVETAAEWLGS